METGSHIDLQLTSLHYLPQDLWRYEGFVHSHHINMSECSVWTVKYLLKDGRHLARGEVGVVHGDGLQADHSRGQESGGDRGQIIITRKGLFQKMYCL